MSHGRTIDAYLSKVPPAFRTALTRLRNAIAAAAPDAEEGFSYGVPAFKIGGKALVCFAAFRNHCGFYPMSPKVLTGLADELSGFDTAKGTIRFQPEKPIPVSLVKKIVKARLAEVTHSHT
jgi:uncharacterized protein YdhG (YjbR/CyaY superfamily)